MRRLALAAPLLAAACLSTADPSKAVFAGIPPERVLDAARTITVEEGFTLEKSSADAHVVSTEWKTSMAPGYRDGVRRRVHIAVRPGKEGAALEVTCEKEINEDAFQPLDADRAHWSGAGYDDDIEDLLAMRIRMKLERLAIEWHD